MDGDWNRAEAKLVPREFDSLIPYGQQRQRQTKGPKLQLFNVNAQQCTKLSPIPGGVSGKLGVCTYTRGF